MVLRYIKKKRRTDKNKRIINNSNKIINAIELFKLMIDNDDCMFLSCHVRVSE